jgi:hypothetical protein
VEIQVRQSITEEFYDQKLQYQADKES